MGFGLRSRHRDQRSSKIHELYAADWKMWFPDEGDPRHGTKDDPRMVLIGVNVHAAVFLEVNKPQPVVLFESIKGWVTGTEPELGEMTGWENRRERKKEGLGRARREAAERAALGGGAPSVLREEERLRPERPFDVAQGRPELVEGRGASGQACQPKAPARCENRLRGASRRYRVGGTVAGKPVDSGPPRLGMGRAAPGLGRGGGDARFAVGCRLR